MTAKPLVLYPRAGADILESSSYYEREAGARVALVYVDRVEEALEFVRQYPAAGSLRWAHELGLPGLRARVVKGFPYLIFYVEGETDVAIWRVLHGQSDIPARLQAATEEPSLD